MLTTVPVIQARISIIESEIRPWCSSVHVRVSLAECICSNAQFRGPPERRIGVGQASRHICRARGIFILSLSCCRDAELNVGAHS